jgi:drug/metabolite transporter (DMT)-like permease
VSREEDLRKIVELGRQTRKPTPRWLWIAASVIGAACAAAFAIAMLGDHGSERPASRPTRLERPAPSERPPDGGSGLGAGLAIGAAAGLVIGFSIARQRRSHSSRNSP